MHKLLKIALAIALSCLSLPSWATIAFVNSVTITGGTSGSNISASFSAISGNTETCGVGFNKTTASVSSVTDTVGSIYTQTVAVNGTNARIEIWSTVLAGTNASNKVTVNSTSGTGNGPGVICVEYSGVNSLGVTNTNSATSSTSATISITTQDLNNFISAFFADSTNVTYTSVTGNLITQVGNSSGAEKSAACNNTVTNPGTLTCAETVGSSNWAAAAVELRTGISAAAGGGQKRRKLEQFGED